MCRTFQSTLNPQHMTVMENMLRGAQHQIGENIVAAALRPAAVRRQEAENLERAWDLLGMVNLRHHSDELAGSLSGGQKKLLALAQVLMAEPRLILLDEPVTGVNPRLIEDMFPGIKRSRDHGKNFTLREHTLNVWRQLR